MFTAAAAGVISCNNRDGIWYIGTRNPLTIIYRAITTRACYQSTVVSGFCESYCFQRLVLSGLYMWTRKFVPPDNTIYRHIVEKIEKFTVLLLFLTFVSIELYMYISMFSRYLYNRLYTVVSRMYTRQKSNF